MNELPNPTVLREMRAASYARYLLAEAAAENDAMLADNRAAAIDTDRDPTIGILVVIAGLLFGVAAFFGALIWALHAIAVRAFT